MIGKPMGKERRLCRVIIIFAFSSFVILVFFPGCKFDSGGLGTGIPPTLGVYCLGAATRFVPTPGAIAGGPPTEPGLPTGKEECENFAESLKMRWEFLRTENPNESPLVATHWDFIDTMTEEGIVFCVLNVVVSSDDINDKGLGTWQIKHEVENWSITCPEVTINQCPTEHNAVDTWVSNTTFGKNECENGLIGIDIIPGPGFP